MQSVKLFLILLCLSAYLIATAVWFSWGLGEMLDSYHIVGPLVSALAISVFWLAFTGCAIAYLVKWYAGAASKKAGLAHVGPVGFLHRHFRDALGIHLGAIAWNQDSLFSIPVYLDPPAEPPAGNWYAAEDIDRHVRALDVLINGEEGASPQAKLCDLVAQLQAKPVFGLDPAKGYALVPTKPSPGVLMSMAIRSDHGLGVPGYYDTGLMLKEGFGVTHAQRLECTLSEMCKLYEEVVGTGFYSVEKESDYVAKSMEVR